jgi:hypothetical protein
MTVRTTTHVDCPCGHRGSIVESKHDDSRSHWYLATMRGLSHSGQYDGLDRLFAETTPACPVRPFVESGSRSFGRKHNIPPRCAHHDRQ